MERVTFRLTDTKDPEERLEEAAVWKALYDATHGSVKLVDETHIPTFGRRRRHEHVPMLRYWEDPAFLIETQREFCVTSIEDVGLAVDKLHHHGKGAFVKSTRDKHAIFKCPVGTGIYEQIGDMSYSFVDGGPRLMVQELSDISYEWRFFCIDREIVTDSNNHPSLTPLDYPLDYAYRTPDQKIREQWFKCSDIREELLPVAKRIAKKMQTPTAVIDCAFINGHAGCVELNPFHLGQVGLFACDVRALVDATLNSMQKAFAWKP